ncbi:MAG: cyclic nucleotide-binding domain-containing protein [Gammaproteobacteria bacterium]|nr:cyclic nucleotide-binding domain-containing protein [Gammaproteobacteria bacterium]
MAIELNSEHARLIRGFIPINTLPGFQFDELCATHQVSVVNDGDELFTEGSIDTDYYFLIEGSVKLEAGKTEVDIVKSDSANARFAIAHHIPRKVTCIAQGEVRYLKVDSEMFSEESVSQMLLENDLIGNDSELVNEEAIPFLLKTPLFRRLSVSVLPGVSSCLEKKTIEAGQTIIEQDELNDTFFIIQHGRCKVTHRPFEDAREIQLDDLQQGDTFGEYALLIDCIADVTVKTATDCEMYTINEKYFDQCIKQPLVKEVDWNSSEKSGCVFLDIQALEEYRKNHIKGSINYPFSTLRVRMGQLSSSNNYVVVSNDGKEGKAAVVLLSQHQLNATLLIGGLKTVPENAIDHILGLDSELLAGDSETESALLLSGRNSALIGTPVSAQSAGKASGIEQQGPADQIDSEQIEKQVESGFADADKDNDTVDNTSVVVDANQVDIFQSGSPEANQQIKKLENKLQEVWKVYKKTRSQLQRSKRKYSACYREYSRIEHDYHNLLIQHDASSGSTSIINPAVKADEINQRLQQEFAQQVETNRKLKEQNSSLKQKLDDAKKALKHGVVLEQDSIVLTKDAGNLSKSESLQLRIQELQDTIQSLELKKNSQQKKARQYVDENNKLRQLIQELAKQAINEQAHDHGLASTFDLSTELASSDNAYDAESRMAEMGLGKNDFEESLLKEINTAKDQNAEARKKRIQDQKGFWSQVKTMFGINKTGKPKTTAWIGITSVVLLALILIFLFLNTKEGQSLLQQMGF